MENLLEALKKSMLDKLEKHDDNEYVILVPFNRAYNNGDFAETKDYVLAQVCFNELDAVIIRKNIIEHFKNKIYYPNYFFHVYRLLKSYNKVEDIERDIRQGKIYIDEDPDEAKGAEIIFGEEYEF